MSSSSQDMSDRMSDKAVEDAARLILHPSMNKENAQNKAQFLSRMGFEKEAISKILHKAQSMDFSNVKVTFGAF